MLCTSISSVSQTYFCFIHLYIGGKEIIETPKLDTFNTQYQYIVINIFLLIALENNRAIFPCICTLCIVIFEKVLCVPKLVLKLHHLSFEDDIARLLQNAEFEEILPEGRNADGINVDKSRIKCILHQFKYEYLKQFNIPLKYNKIHNSFRHKLFITI